MNQYEQERQNKLDKIRELNLPSYSVYSEDLASSLDLPFYCSNGDVDIDGKYVLDLSLTPETGTEISLAGRVIRRREMGNLHFLTLRDEKSDFQVALSKKLLSYKEWQLAKLLDLGDVIFTNGNAASTKKEEPTLWVKRLSLSAKSLLVPPEKTKGLEDVELKIRNRHIDLWSYPKTMKTARQRSRIVKGIRTFLDDYGFVEVETPILQSVPGGAAAKPFSTYHNALDIPLYMRVAPELYLKRLIIGGMSRVFEIGKNFRNEGISAKHNPEFTSLELYKAYSNYEDMMHIVENMVEDFTYEMQLGDITFQRVTMTDLVNEFVENAPSDLLEIHKIFETEVQQKITKPTFVTHLPSSVVPLAKHDDQGHAMAFELIVNGQEIGCGYSEENDPQIQLKKLKEQAGEETQRIDWDFIQALKSGMPPTGGLGIGVDRLVMWLTELTNIRDVILFPTVRTIS